MQAMMIDNELSATVNEIARELNISQQDFLKQAIEDYVKKSKNIRHCWRLQGYCKKMKQMIYWQQFSFVGQVR